jgi:hypothetical protein
MANLRARNWIYTINNPTEDCTPSSWPDVKYMIWQKERGVNGTEHFQGYVSFGKPMRMAALKKISQVAHWEVRKGTEQQCIDYCSKQDTRIAGPWEVGVRPSPGKRNDLLDAVSLIDSGKTMKEVATIHPTTYVKYSRGLCSYERVMAPRRTSPPEVIVVFGPTGTGKSQYCREQSPDAYWKPTGTEWFDDYDGRSDIIIDEFYGWIMFSHLLRILDSYPLMLATKGSHVNINCKRIFITSNQCPSKWFKNVNFSALRRRISKMYMFMTFEERYAFEYDLNKVQLSTYKFPQDDTKVLIVAPDFN